MAHAKVDTMHLTIAPTSEAAHRLTHLSILLLYLDKPITNEQLHAKPSHLRSGFLLLSKVENLYSAMAESSQLTSHKKQIEQDVSSDMPPTSSVVKREHRRHETQL